jgi:hypothetical protein
MPRPAAAFSRSATTSCPTSSPRSRTGSRGFAFRDETALHNFLGDPAMADLWKQFDAFIGPHGHHASDRPLVYRAPSLSVE